MDIGINKLYNANYSTYLLTLTIAQGPNTLHKHTIQLMIYPALSSVISTTPRRETRNPSPYSKRKTLSSNHNLPPLHLS
jgi:hypothetical protein